MGRLWLPVAIVLLLPVGCATDEEPQPPRHAHASGNAKSAKPPAEVVKPRANLARPQAKMAKPQMEITGQSGAQQVDPKHPYDKFELPLVIRMDVPEVPPEVERPSPPVEHKEEPAWQFPNPLRLFQQNPKSP